MSRLLSPSIRVVIDPGQLHQQGPRVLSGISDAVQILLHGTTPAPGRELTLREVNSQAGLILMRGESAETVIGIDFVAGLASVIWVRLNPDYRRHGNTT